jgi:hypothetical protein
LSSVSRKVSRHPVEARLSLKSFMLPERWGQGPPPVGLLAADTDAMLSLPPAAMP